MTVLVSGLVEALFGDCPVFFSHFDVPIRLDIRTISLEDHHLAAVCRFRRFPANAAVQLRYVNSGLEAVSEVDKCVEDRIVRLWNCLLWDVLGCRVGVRLHIAIRTLLGRQLVGLKPLLVSESHWACKAVRGHGEVIRSLDASPVPFSGDSVLYTGFSSELGKQCFTTRYELCFDIVRWECRASYDVDGVLHLRLLRAHLSLTGFRHRA